MLSPLFPIAFMLYLAYLTARTSSTSIFQKHTCLFVMAFGLACSKITIKLVVSMMIKESLCCFCCCCLISDASEQVCQKNV